MQTDIRQGKGLLRNFLSVTAGNYVAIGLSFALNVYLTRLLGVERFGKLALLLMGIQVLGCFLSNWTLTGFVKFGAQEFARSGKISESFWVRTVVMMPWVLVAALALFIAQEQAASYFDIPLWGVWLLFGYYFLTTLLLTIGAAFQASEQMNRYAATLFLEKGFVLLGIILLPAPYSHEPLSIIACYALGSLIVCVWGIWFLGWKAFSPIRVPRESVLAMWRFSFPMIFSTWIGVINSHWIAYAIIKHFLALSELGKYSLAIQVTGVVQQITIILATLLLPHYSVLVDRHQQEEIKRSMQEVVPYALLGFSLLLGGVILLADGVIPWLFGNDFRGAVQPLVLLMVATMALALYNAFLPLLTAYGSTWTLTAILTICAIINVVFGFVLVPIYGINGTALAMVLSYVVAACLMLAVIEARTQVPVLRLLWFIGPVVIVAVLHVLMKGAFFYVAGVVGMVVGGCLLAAVFGLFDEKRLSVLVHGNVPNSSG